MTLPLPAYEESIELLIHELVFRSPDGRFVVAKGTRPNGHGEVTAVGDLGGVHPGESMRLRGRWQEHATFGKRFRVTSFTPITPKTAEGIVRYLGSGLIEGIGKGLAKRLVEHFGADAIEVITTQSERLREVSGIGKQRAARISAAVRERRAEADQMSFLHAHGLGPSLARKVMAVYGEDSARTLTEDPYLVAEQVNGIGFRTADQIGRSIGIADDDPRRACGATLHVAAKLADRGHVYATLDQISSENSALGVGLSNTRDALKTLVEREMLIADEDRYYPPPLFFAEQICAERMARLARPREAPSGAERAEASALESQSLSEEQASAVRLSIQAGLMVLTGGPGTGKTTTVRAILHAQEKLERRVLLCAPTGRAAKRLTESTGAEAMTIHRMLEWNPMSGRFVKNANEPLETDVVLVDEASMLNLTLASQLLSAIAPSSRLIMVGDVDQLPPVGAGQVLRELLSSEVADCVRLTQVFRQAEESAIVRGAHDVLRGGMPKTSAREDVGKSGELYIMRAPNASRAPEQLVTLINRLASRYKLDPLREIMVVSPTRRGPLGTERLNEILQSALNANVEPEKKGMFFEGDKVMQLKNDYEREVYNGDLGIITRIQGGLTAVNFDGREIRYKVPDLDALTLAYATTVHKVQGSEFPAIVVVLHPSHHVLLSRALLYTALTRAKQVGVLFGDERAMLRAAKNAEAYESQSRLAHRLMRALDANEGET